MYVHKFCFSSQVSLMLLADKLSTPLATLHITMSSQRKCGILLWLLAHYYFQPMQIRVNGVIFVDALLNEIVFS